MPDSQQILEYLRQNGPSMAGSIAHYFGCSKTDINRILYHEQESTGVVERDDRYFWSIKEVSGTVAHVFRPTQASLDFGPQNSSEMPSGSSSPTIVPAPASTPPPNPAMPQTPEAAPNIIPSNRASAGGSSMPAVANAVKMLEFLEEWAKALNKPLLDVRKDSRIQFSLTEEETVDVAGLSLGDNSAWLRLERKVARKVPEPPTAIHRWIKLKDDPFKGPSLLQSIPGPVDPEHPDEPPGQLFLVDHPEVSSEFDRYMKETWSPWSESERPVRRAVKLYQTLFGLRQRFERPGAGEAIEMLWGIGMCYWKAPGIRTPLFLQPVEFAPTSEDLSIEIHAVDRTPLPNLDALMSVRGEGTVRFEQDLRSWLGQEDPPISPFAPERFGGMLDLAAARIDDNALRIPRNPGGTPTEELTITEEWCLLCRTRSADYMLEDVARLKRTIESDGLPAGAVAEIAVPREDPLPELEWVFRGVSTPGVSSEDHCRVEDLFFPKPFNREQVQVVKNLERGYGVVLQGPPGTGKTHTIANIICHYLALGRRVLVTSKDAPALQVLREQLPEDLKPLTASILSQERGALREMEQGMSRITSEVVNLNREEYLERQKELTRRVDELHARLARIEKQLLQQAKRFLEPIPEHLGAFDPPTLARELAESAERHSWFPDKLDPDAGWKPDEITNESFQSLRESRLKLRNKLSIDPSALIDPTSLPGAEEVQDVHAHLIEDAELETQVDATGRYQLRPITTPEECTTAVDTRNALARAISILSEVQSEEWKKFLYCCLQVPNSLPSHPPAAILVPQIKELLTIGEQLSHRLGHLIAYDIEVASQDERHKEFLDRCRRAAEGGSPTGFIDIGINRRLCKQLSEIKINGKAPASADDWKLVVEHCELELLAEDLKRKWNNLASKVPLRALECSGLPVVGEFADFHSLSVRFQKFGQTERRELRNLTERVFVRFDLPNLSELVEHPTEFLVDAEAVLRIAIMRFGCHDAKYKRNKWIQFVAAHTTAPLAQDLLDFLKTSLGSPEKKPVEILSEWTKLRAAIENLWAIKPDLEYVAEVADWLEERGAMNWSSAIRSIPVAERESADPVVPTSSYESWLWAKQNAFLSHIDQKELLRKLNRERLDAEKKLATTYELLAVNRTWLALRETLDRKPQLLGALQSFVQNIALVGAGAGPLAPHYRRIARQQMQKAHEAIRCWIMPEWRVSENLPPEVGVFDLVIIDEASQSDMRALPAIMRGKKILVVGDDKQVSPSQVGVSSEIIEALYVRFLRHLPHGDSMSVRNSIYDLASVAFAGSIVRLREHFRCVEPIINFSSHQFYGGEIKCVRVPKASERLLPCLICIRVLHGRRHEMRKVNHAEAEAIVDEISILVADPAFGSRTIGIISLLGNEQPRVIFDELRSRLGEEVIVRHQIRAGDAAFFQGSEFDVVFLSMVASGRPTVSTTRNFEQRYNVAASRARDRMYLFHSLDPSVLGPNDLRWKLLQHFSNPRTMSVAAGREACESPFEEEVYDHLVGLGYRVLTQVPAAGKRIDLVVEDSTGRRLALECDGYVAHPPHRWLEDLSRQRLLERAGWVFHRIWGPSYYRDKMGALAELVSVLESHGLSPDGGDGTGCLRVVEHREVGPPQDQQNDAESETGDPLIELVESLDSEAEASDAPSDFDDVRNDSRRSLFDSPLPDVETETGVEASSGLNAAPLVAETLNRLPGTELESELPEVKVGRTVEVEFLDDPDGAMRFTITEGPTILEEGLINYSSPLNSAILDHRQGEVIEAQIAGVTRSVRIVKVEVDGP